MAQTLAKYVFMSYSRSDEKVMQRIAAYLRDQGVNVWVDNERLSPGTPIWEVEIGKAIMGAGATVALLSPDSRDSPWVLRELGYSESHQKRIFPVMVRGDVASSVPLRLFTSEYVNIQKNESIGLSRLCAALRSYLDELEAEEGSATEESGEAALQDSQRETSEIRLREIEPAQVDVPDEWLEKFRSRFVLVEGGTFVMGDVELHAELKALQEHECQVDSFRMGKYVVTQSEWTELMDIRPWSFENNVTYGDNIPAVFITLGDAMRFIGKINRSDPQFGYRLPTEAEWEYAARGGQMASGRHTKFCFGNDENKLLEYGWFRRNAVDIGVAYAHPVGELKANQLGLFDMHGNIWEWTSDTDGTTQVVRGGGYNAPAIAASSAYRLSVKPEMKGEALGFRLVQEPK